MDVLISVLAQASSAPSQTDLLKLFQESQAQLTTSFNLFLSAISLIIVIVGVLLAVAGFNTRQDINRTVQEIKLSVAEQVRKEVNRQIADKVDTEIRYLTNVLEREAILGQTRVEYVMFSGTVDRPPVEYGLLKTRGFQITPLLYNPDRPWPDSSIFVLDLVNAEITPERQEALITDIGHSLLRQWHGKAVLVIYVKGNINAVKAFPPELLYLLSNMRGTLIGAVVNAAHAAQALRNHFR